jgi:hypothetical protein
VLYLVHSILMGVGKLLVKLSDRYIQPYLGQRGSPYEFSMSQAIPGDGFVAPSVRQLIYRRSSLTLIVRGLLSSPIYPINSALGLLSISWPTLGLLSTS